ncbi:hypothetical protein RND81_13G096200 [Saponaria officinalis]|uniref:Uncharacterized protein n=1 Tax=Saponaria officinalis TaxID=3572 RepID=A0AAW1GVN0_SAPOF
MGKITIIISIFLAVFILCSADDSTQSPVPSVLEDVKVKCCFDNHIGKCIPGDESEEYCNQLCLQSSCNKGGRCKVFQHKPPNHYCHCYC